MQEERNAHQAKYTAIAFCDFTQHRKKRIVCGKRRRRVFSTFGEGRRRSRKFDKTRNALFRRGLHENVCYSVPLWMHFCCIIFAAVHVWNVRLHILNINVAHSFLWFIYVRAMRFKIMQFFIDQSTRILRVFRKAFSCVHELRVEKETHKGKTAIREATKKVGHISISFGFDSKTNEKKCKWRRSRR